MTIAHAKELPKLTRENTRGKKNHAEPRGCVQKFPDWPPRARTANGKFSATRCSCITIL
jgi:hypothetical protein